MAEFIVKKNHYIYFSTSYFQISPIHRTKKHCLLQSKANKTLDNLHWHHSRSDPTQFVWLFVQLNFFLILERHILCDISEISIELISEQLSWFFLFFCTSPRPRIKSDCRQWFRFGMGNKLRLFIQWEFLKIEYK